MTLGPGESRLIRRHYLGLQERVLFEAHPSRWFYFVKPTFLAAITIAFVYLVVARSQPSLPLSGVLAPTPNWSLGLWPQLLYAIAVVLVLISVAVTGRSLWLWAGQTYAVTDQRLIQQKGIVRHVIQEIPLQQVRDVDVYQDSFWARVLFRVGTVRVKSLSEVDFPDYVRRGLASSAVPTDGSLSLRTQFDQLEHILDPKHPLARASGIEWWVGVPNPFRIEREIANATRALSHSTGVVAT